MPEFNPEEERVAIATFPTKPAGLECAAELWLASNMTKVATSGEIPFTATGGDKSISLPITLPGVEGTYPVYLYVFSNGQLIASFLGDEEVVIVVPVELPLDLAITSIDSKSWDSYWIMQPHCRIYNPHSVPVTRLIYCYWLSSGKIGSDPDDVSQFVRCGYWDSAKNTGYPVTLAPGQSVTLISPYFYKPRTAGVYYPNYVGGYHGYPTRRKYYFRMKDDLGNWSPYVSIGTYDKRPDE